MANKNFYMVLDTETCGELVFDIGFKVIDRAGNCYAQGSYVVKEFIDDPAALDMFNDRFTRNKIGKYYFNLWNNSGNFEVATFPQIRNIINYNLYHFNAILCAYNIAFDVTHLEKTANYFGIPHFFEVECKTLDVWHMAMSVLGTNNYIKFCINHKFLTNAGNIPTGAEIMYRFITNDIEFIEEHTARADCDIEAAIMVKCFNRKKHFETSTVGMCLHCKEWQRIQEQFENLK